MPSQSKRSQITYEHNLHIRRCHTTLHIRSNKGDKFVFTDVFFFLSLRLLQHIPVKWLTLINLIVTPAYNLGKRICRKTPCLMAIHFHANFLPLAKRPQSKIEIMEKKLHLFVLPNGIKERWKLRYKKNIRELIIHRLVNLNGSYKKVINSMKKNTKLDAVASAKFRHGSDIITV